MLKNFCISILFAIFSINTFAQNESNVPYQSLVAINPSFAGSNGFVRNQLFVVMPVISNQNYFSFNNAFDAYLPSLKSGIALSVNHYQYNTNYKNTYGTFSYAKYFRLNENLKIIPSIQIGYTARKIYAPYIVMNGYIQPTPNSPWINSNYFSLNGGLLVNYKSFYGGVSVFNINSPDIGFTDTERTSPLVYFHASYNLKLSDKLVFDLYGQYGSSINHESQAIAISALIFKHLIYGVGRQWRDMAVMNVGYRTNYFVLQLAYNRNINKIRLSDRRSDYWQFIMSFNLRNKEQRNSLMNNFEAW